MLLGHVPGRGFLRDRVWSQGSSAQPGSHPSARGGGYCRLPAAPWLGSHRGILGWQGWGGNRAEAPTHFIHPPPAPDPSSQSPGQEPRGRADTGPGRSSLRGALPPQRSRRPRMRLAPGDALSGVLQRDVSDHSTLQTGWTGLRLHVSPYETHEIGTGTSSWQSTLRSPWKNAPRWPTRERVTMTGTGREGRGGRSQLCGPGAGWQRLCPRDRGAGVTFHCPGVC